MENNNKNNKGDELAEEFSRSVALAIKKYGSQKELSAHTGIHQSRISDYANSRYNFFNLTVGTLIKLFPQLDITYNIQVGTSADSAQLQKEMEKRMIKKFRSLSIKDKLVFFESMSSFCRDKIGGTD